MINKKMNYSDNLHINKSFLRFAIVIMLFICIYAGSNVKAASNGYMYSSDGNLIECSVGMTVTEDGIYSVLSESWSGFTTDNKAEDFNSPADMCLYKDETGKETLYVVDSGSNKLFVYDGSLRYLKTISEFVIKPSKFTDDQLARISTRAANNTSTKFWTNDVQSASQSGTPVSIKCLNLSGVYRGLRPLKDAEGKNVLDENEKTVYQDIIYLCDSNNRQVLLLDAQTYEVIQVVSAPQNVDFSDKFQPSKIVIDVTGRMYIISINVYEGILLMDYYGNFMRMVGVNYTTLSVWDAIKRNFKTEEQLQQETSILQTTFNNLSIDSKGFLYTISGAIKNADGTTNSEAMIKRINQANADVLKRNGYSSPKGDIITIKTGSQAGGSNFVAITVNKYGVYTVADAKYNRLFTYDNEGNLLYISGGAGNQVTDLNNPTAIAYQGENILVLDKGNKCIMRFEPTNFASKINKAVEYEFIGDAISAADQWQNVINANPAYELAYVGVGKKLYSEGRYQEAMLNFEKGADVDYYSRAYKMYRDDKIKQYFPTAVLIIAILIVLRIAFKIYKKAKNKKPYEDGEYL